MHPVERSKKVYKKDDTGFLYTYMQVKAKDIKADPRYNRVVIKRHVEEIVKKFDPNLLDPCKVSFRDGVYWIFDGNHRLRALIERHNGKDDFFVDCKVYEGMTVADEARMFALQNGSTTKVSKDSVLRALYEAKDEEVVRFKNVTNLAGAKCTFNATNSPYCIKCYSTAYEIFRRYGSKHYTDVIRTIINAKDGHPDSLRREIICGVDILIRSFPDIDLDRLTDKLRQEDCKLIIASGKADVFHTGNTRYAAQLGILYNKKLPEKKKLDLRCLQ